MGWFDQFLSPGQMPGGQGLPPSGPPPDDSPDWFWDGSAWTKAESPNGWPGQPTPPSGGPPATPPGTTPVPPNNAASALGGASGPTPWASTWNPGQALAGWDQTKWNDQNKQNEKYKVGRILSKYPPTVDGLKKAWPEIKAAYPDASFDGKDGITIPALGAKKIDVLRGASNGGTDWQWIDNNVDESGSGNMGNLGVPPVTPNTGVAPVGGGYSAGGAGGYQDSGWQMPKGSDYQFGGVPGYSSGAFGMPSSVIGGDRNRLPMDPTDPSGIGQTYQRGPMDPSKVAAGHLAGAMPPSPDGMPSPDRVGMQSVGGFAPPSRDGFQTPDRSLTGQTAQSGAFGLGQSTSADGLQTRDRQPVSSTDLGRGQMTPDRTGLTSTTDPNRIVQDFGQFGSGMMDKNGSSTLPGHASAAPPNTGGYDRAPSFTPLDPFKAPPVPDAYKEWTPDKASAFKLPSWEEVMANDPGIQFGIDQGTKAYQSSAAGKGLLRTGGTLKGIGEYVTKAATQGYGDAVNRGLAVANQNMSATGQNNAFGLQGYQFNADQKQQNYKNKYDAANQGYAYANQQNLAGNNQALEGYKTDVGRELGRMGINLTASQNAAVNALNGQQQQWMQAYLMNGQSFDQAYKLMMAKLQYPA